MAKENFLKARLTPEQSDALEQIVNELQEQMPEGTVTISSVARYALEAYIAKHVNQNAGKKVYIEVDVDGVTSESLKYTIDLLLECMGKAEEQHEKETGRILNSVAVPLSREEFRRLTARK